MAVGERDSTWEGLPAALACAPPFVELERRVDEALATARASEAAVMRVGVAALDAAEQARHAAGLAERASAFAATLAGHPLPQHEPPLSPRPIDAALLPPEPAAGEIRVSAAAAPVAACEDKQLRDLNLRADRLADRLRAIGNRPVGLAA